MSNQLSEDEQALLEILEKKRNQSKARSKKYYESNRAKVLERQKKARANNKDSIEDLKNKMSIQINIDALENIETENEIVEVESPPVVNKNKSNKLRDYTEDELINLISTSDKITASSKITYKSSTRRIFKATGCKTLKPCLNNHKTMIAKITNNKEYGSSAKLLIYQVLLKLNTLYGILSHMFNEKKAETVREHLDHEYDKYKFISKQESDKKKETLFVPTWSDYLKKTNSNFGTDSLEYLLAVLYSNLTIRDNYSEMKIVPLMKDTTDKSKNFFVLNRKNEMWFVINRFKTDKKLNKLVYKVEIPNLKQMLLKYIDTKKKKYDDYLFGKSKLSSIISKMNKINNYTYEDKSVGGVDFLRHISASQMSDGEYDKLSYEERKKLADQMLHSVATNKQYRRNLKVTKTT
jgi:hypothetical protein